MRKILALIRSPCKLGNSEILVKEIRRQIREPHLLKMLRPVDFNIQKVGHNMALNLEDTLKHREWLIGMKSKFKLHKDQLKKICLDYRGDGDWIIPLDDIK